MARSEKLVRRLLRSRRRGAFFGLADLRIIAPGPGAIEASSKTARRQSDKISVAAYAQVPVDDLVLGGPCSGVFLDPGRHIFRPWLAMTNRRLPDVSVCLPAGLRVAAGSRWYLIGVRHFPERRLRHRHKSLQ